MCRWGVDLCLQTLPRLLVIDSDVIGFVGLFRVSGRPFKSGPGRVELCQPEHPTPNPTLSESAQVKSRQLLLLPYYLRIVQLSLDCRIWKLQRKKSHHFFTLPTCPTKVNVNAMLHLPKKSRILWITFEDGRVGNPIITQVPRVHRIRLSS